MDKATRDQLRAAVVAARELLESDFFEQLEGQYGIRASGEMRAANSLTHLDTFGHARRQSIISTILHYAGKDARGLSFADNAEKAMTVSAVAVARYVREAAFTALNRLAALKLMEAENRRLIRPSVGAYRDSTGFKEFSQVSPELVHALPDGGYAFYIQLLYDDLAYDLHFLFDRDLPQAVLFPSETCLRAVLDILNEPVLRDVWTRDETIGWIYQYYTPKKLRDDARKENAAPQNAYELAFRNQFYTPRYVVEFLVDNTLARLWREMRQGATRLVEHSGKEHLCRYLLRPPDQPIPQRAKRDPRTLRALDPACGSGHYLLYGYDLFEIIYDEAYDDPDIGPALQSEYPTRDEFRRAVPELILRHNLHGIDIDLRAVQIAALALWLRAQRSFQQLGLRVAARPQIRRVNIVAAEKMPGEQDLLDGFLNELENPALRNLVRVMWNAMQATDEIGSLHKIEQILRGEIAKAKRAWEDLDTLEQLKMFEVTPQLKQQKLDFSFISDAEFWEQVEARVLEELEQFARSVTNGRAYARKLFADDTERGFALMDLLREPFDVVWMNPPFGAASKGAKPYIEKNYPLTKNDLYAAFVERGLELLNPRGMLGAITSRTGFFLTSFREWREDLLIPKTEIHAVADLGFGVLDTAMVETAAYVLEKKP